MKHNWQEVKLSMKSSINDAIEAINRSGLRVALITDENDKFVGTVTDGDIRRALLNHRDLSLSVVEVMNTKPVFADTKATKAKLIALMQKDQLVSIPVVNDKQELVDLVSFHQLVKMTTFENPIFLMAGGFGTRLRPLTENCPKPLLKIGGKPILEKIIENFIKAGFHKFYISTHYMPEKITNYFGDGSKWGVSIEYVHEQDPLGTGGALGLLPDTLPDLPIIMMNGDVLTNVDFVELLEYHTQKQGICTMCVTEYEYQVPYGVIQAQEHRVTELVEKPVHKYFVNAGIYIVEPKLAHKVKPNQVIDMPSLIEQQIADSQTVSLYPLHEYWKDIGQIGDFNQAQDDIYSLGL